MTFWMDCNEKIAFCLRPSGTNWTSFFLVKQCTTCRSVMAHSALSRAAESASISVISYGATLRTREIQPTCTNYRNFPLYASIFARWVPVSSASFRVSNCTSCCVQLSLTLHQSVVHRLSRSGVLTACRARLCHCVLAAAP